MHALLSIYELTTNISASRDRVLLHLNFYGWLRYAISVIWECISYQLTASSLVPALMSFSSFGPIPSGEIDSSSSLDTSVKACPLLVARVTMHSE